MVGEIVRTSITDGVVMPAFRDKRDNKTWRYRKRILLPSGKRIRIEGTPPINTMVAAEAAERAHIERELHPQRVRVVDAPKAKQKEVPTLKEFQVRFMLEYLPRQKPSERNSKESILESALVPFFGPMRLDEIDQSAINRFVGAQTTAVKTINNKLAVLSTLLGYAVTCRVMPRAEVELEFQVSGAKSEIISVPIADVAKLIAATADDRYRAAILLASEAGLRIGEIRGLQHTDVRDGCLTVRRAVDALGNVGTPKHDKVRSVPLSPALASALAAVKRRGLWVVGRLDGGMLGYDAVREAIHEIYTRAKVTIPRSETGVTMPWHSLRHTFGTTCAARNVPMPVLMKLMGHAQVETTMRYVDVTQGQMVNEIARAFGGRQVGDNFSDGVQATKK